MKKIEQGYFDGERALFATEGAHIADCMFADGESPLKESRDLVLEGCIFGWKYPLWYSKNVVARNITLLEGARSGIWYTDNISITDSVIEAPKTFRRSSGIALTNVTMPNAKETFWNCRDISIKNVSATGDYFCFGAENVTAENLTLNGNYGFDGGRNITVINSKLISKDAFWNCENVTVYDSLIVGEYLGWNSKNVTLVNCTVQSLQGMCYMQGLKLVNCKVLKTELAFEYSSVEADIVTRVDSIKNPLAGSNIKAHSVGELILDERYTQPEKINVVTEN